MIFRPAAKIAIVALYASLCACAQTADLRTPFSALAELIAGSKRVGDPVHGHQIAAGRCANCHALEFEAHTPGAAPTFPWMATQSALTVSRLRKILVRLPHPMPPIRLDEQEIYDVIAYIHQSGVSQR